MNDITAIILTFNEEKNIAECINSIKSVVKRIVVVDSYSTDNTLNIARELGAEVFQHEFFSQSQQFVWATENINIDSKWIFRIDADERLTEKSASELTALVKEHDDDDVNGIVVRFEVNFMGKRLCHGGIYPFKKLLVYKSGKGHMEPRNMDEHIVLDEGKSVEMKSDSIHKDYKGLYEWIDKHNKYSSREVLDYIQNKNNDEDKHLNKSAKFKRFIKFKIYYKLPMGFRAKLYYWYRYYLKFGFLDGKEGKIFAFLQAYWYRFLVDAKIYEERLSLKEKEHNA